MKKHIKLTAVLSTAAVMAAFTPVLTFPVLAQSKGWIQEDENWKFYDDDGYYLTDTWKRHDNNWYYLDGDGNISFNSQVDEYYVDGEGKRVANQWVIIPNEDYDDSEDSPESYWFYYGTDGKMTTSKFRKVDGLTYYFDSEGHMATGLTEIDGANYYFGKPGDGSMKTGWVELTEDQDNGEEEIVWSYFNSNGQRIENQIDKRVGSNYYTFVDGKMVTGWYKLPKDMPTADAEQNIEADVAGTEGLENAADGQVQDAADAEQQAPAQDAADAEQQAPAQDDVAPAQDDANAGQQEETNNTAAGYQYYNEDGSRASGWMTITGIPGLSEEDEFYKFYFKSGKPYFAEKDIQVFRVGSARHCFNEKGEMQTGLQVITLEDGSKVNYYFGTDGVMKTGKQSILDEESGITQTWFFHTDSEKLGQSFHGIRDNVIYDNGLRQQAESYMRYAPVTFEGKNYLVNASGTIQKASNSSKSHERPDLGVGYRDLKDAFDNTWTIDVNGIIQ